MGTLFSKAWLATTFIFVVAMETTEGTGYLVRIGPASLRFQTVVAAANPPVLPPLSQDDNNSTAPRQVSDGTQTSSLNWSPFSLSSPWTVYFDPLKSNGPSKSSVEQPVEITERPSPNPSYTAPAAHDVLATKPEMLVDYFKPNTSNASTNSAGVSVLVPINFTPPTAAPPSSQAIYRSP